MAESPVRGIDHVAIVVRDMEASLPYYQHVLGMSILDDAINTAAGVRLVYLSAGRETIQLVCPFAAGALADALATRGEGLHHICFQVDDIASAVQTLAPDAAVTVSVGGRNRLTAFLPDRPNGLIIELTEIDEVDGEPGPHRQPAILEGA